MTDSLIAKYNVAGPRYTSYPTVPYWNTAAFSQGEWQQRLITAFNKTNEQTGISLYIHLPYCESLCTFCGCNKRITRNHAVEQPYIDALLTEWDLYCDLFSAGAGDGAPTSRRPRIAELHLGGGTPSFFSTHELQRLLTGLFRWADPVDEGVDFGWEGHPNNTTYGHLKTLYNFGFRRVSFGVQDYDPVVQRAIHRHQPFENVQRVTEQAREIGYTSISHDLVFGLPFQRLESIESTIAKTLRLRPDRISFYSYAHVPWIKGNGQRGFQDQDLPNGDEKRALYESGRALLEAGGYTEIGMDHFALPNDPLYEAQQTGALHRSFMGYTTNQTEVLLGLGVSAISDVGTAFMQNHKDVKTYEQRLGQNQLPVCKGHLLTPSDSKVRQRILDIMCRYQTKWSPDEWSDTEWHRLTQHLDLFKDDGLLDYDENGLQVYENGHPFLRNICMAFDMYLSNETVFSMPVFSQTV